MVIVVVMVAVMIVVMVVVMVVIVMRAIMVYGRQTYSVQHTSIQNNK
jgi:hypothetical protein